jgi:hypothetical protein
MTDLDKAIRLARQRTNIDTRPAIMGDESGNLYETDSNGSTGRYWARVQIAPNIYERARAFDLSRTTTGVRVKVGRAVRIGFEDSREVIMGEDTIVTRSQGQNPSGTNTGDANFAGLVNKERIYPFYCTPIATTSKPFYARVYPDNLVAGRDVKVWAGGDVDLSGEQPAAGNHQYTVIGWISSSNTLELGSSTPQADSSALDSTDLQEAIDDLSAGTSPLWAFVLDGDDSVLSASNSIDLRDIAGVSGGIDTGIYVLITPESSTRNVIQPSGDFIPFTIKGHATQTQPYFVIKDSADATELSVSTAGQLAIPTTGSGAGVLIGGDVQLYRSAADVLRINDAVTIRDAKNANAQALYVPWLAGDSATATALFGSNNASNNKIAVWALAYSNTALRGNSVTGTGVVGGGVTGVTGTGTGIGGTFNGGTSFGVSCQSSTGTPLDAIQIEGSNNSNNDTISVRKRTTGTPAAGMASSIFYQLESTAGTDQNAGRIKFSWVDATHASRFSSMSLTTYNIANETTPLILSPSATINAQFESPLATSIGVVIKGAASQSANLTERKNSAGTLLSGADNNGVIIMGETTTPTALANYAKLYPKTDDRLYWQDGAGTEKTIIDSDDTVDEFIALTSYDAEPARGSETNLHGGLLSLATGQALDSTPTNIVVTKGIGKLLVVINAGGDVSGSITVTGTSVDRDDGSTTPADTDTLTVDALTTDNSDTDTNGNTRHAFTGAYITSKWFHGTVTLSTADLTLTDVDVYHVSFEQFNDQSNLTLTTFDVNLFTTNVNAEFDGYLYCLEVTGDKADISRTASLNVGADGFTALANKYERLRRGNLAKALDGTTDGIWVDIHYSNSPAYIEDVTVKVWAKKTQSITPV